MYYIHKLLLYWYSGLISRKTSNIYRQGDQLKYGKIDNVLDPREVCTG